MKPVFKDIGYFVEYLIDTKLIGTKIIEKADREMCGWYMWNGIAMTRPKWVKHTDGKIYSGDDWYEMILNKAKQT